jgi:DNA-binding response OmpR family regulator
MLTAQTGETDKISGLEVGADDYIAKPFSPRELLARIQSVMRRYDAIEQSEDTNTLSYKNIEIQLDKNTVSVDGNEVNLTKNEFDILKKVFEQDGKLVLRETLMKEVI